MATQSNSENMLTVHEEQGNFVLFFSFGLDASDKTDYKILELKLSSIAETIGRIHTKLNRYVIKHKKKKRREIRKADAGNIDEESKKIDETDLDIYMIDTTGERVQDESRPNEEVLVPGSQLVLQFGDDVHCFHIRSLNCPRVKLMRLPDYLMVGYMLYPRLTLEHAELRHSAFSWYRRVVRGFDGADDEEWQLLSEGSWHYTPTDHDLGHQLKVTCIPQNKSGESGLAVECISSNIVIPSPGPCPFEERHTHTTQKTGAESFRLVTYNILADFYASKDTTSEFYYPHAPPYALELDYRKQLIIKEILGYNCDILCLQEVDQKVMDCDLDPVLSDLGFEGFLRIKRRTSSQGIATFYRKDKFKLLSRHARKVKDALSEDSEQQDLKARIEQNPSVAHQFIIVKSVILVMVLEDRASGRVLVIGNTHLFSNVKCPHIRLLQMAVYLNHLEVVVARHKAKGSDVTLIVCGDFNSTPRSGVNVLLSTGSVPNSHVDWFGGQKRDRLENMNVTQPFNMTSVHGYPEYTNYVPNFYGCIDYVYAETEKLKCVHKVPLPRHEDVVKHSALPNPVFPSDHLALVCDLTWV